MAPPSTDMGHEVNSRMVGKVFCGARGFARFRTSNQAERAAWMIDFAQAGTVLGSATY